MGPNATTDLTDQNDFLLSKEIFTKIILFGLVIIAL